MGCGASSDAKERIDALQIQNDKLHQRNVQAEVEKERATTQKDMLQKNLDRMEAELKRIEIIRDDLQHRLGKALAGINYYYYIINP